MNVFRLKAASEDVAKLVHDPDNEGHVKTNLIQMVLSQGLQGLHENDFESGEVVGLGYEFFVAALDDFFKLIFLLGGLEESLEVEDDLFIDKKTGEEVTDVLASLLVK